MDKKYCGNAKVIETQYGELTRISITSEDIATLQKNLDNGWVNVTIKKRKEPSKGGMTHYLEIDTFQKEKKEAGSGSAVKEDPEEALPF